MIKVKDNFQLVPIKETDAWQICDFVNANEDRLKRYFPKTLELNLNPTLSNLFARSKVNAFSERVEFVFLLKQMQPKQLAGIFYLKALDWQHKKAELAYCIGYQFQGQNLTTLAIKQLSEFAFDTFSMETLKIIVHHENQASLRVAEKAGFRFMGILEKEFTPPGEPALDMQLFELKHTERQN